VTFNRGDFEILLREYFEHGRDHAGMIIGRRSSPYELARRILAALTGTTAEQMQNRVIYI
jgi:hypothetical protein